MIKTEKMMNKKIKVPFGFLSLISKKSKASTQSVGAALGIYEETNIGVSAATSERIKKAAILVAEEQKKEIDDFVGHIN
jgi:hypothetical protein